MTRENESQQKLTPRAGKSIAEKNKIIPPEEHSFTDYMQLYPAAQWLRFPQKVEREFIANYYDLTIKTTGGPLWRVF